MKLMVRDEVILPMRYVDSPDAATCPENHADECGRG